MILSILLIVCSYGLVLLLCPFVGWYCNNRDILAAENAAEKRAAWEKEVDDALAHFTFSNSTGLSPTNNKEN